MWRENGGGEGVCCCGRHDRTVPVSLPVSLLQWLCLELDPLEIECVRLSSVWLRSEAAGRPYEWRERLRGWSTLGPHLQVGLCIGVCALHHARAADLAVDAARRARSAQPAASLLQVVARADGQLGLALGQRVVLVV